MASGNGVRGLAGGAGTRAEQEPTRDAKAAGSTVREPDTVIGGELRSFRPRSRIAACQSGDREA